MKSISQFLRVLILSMVQVLGDTKAILVAVSDDIEYVAGKATDKVIGTKYEVVCPSMKYMTATIKVPSSAIIRQDQIDAAASAGTQIWVTFEGFAGRLYQMNGELGVSCKAEKATIVSDAGGKTHEKNS